MNASEVDPMTALPTSLALRPTPAEVLVEPAGPRLDGWVALAAGWQLLGRRAWLRPGGSVACEHEPPGFSTNAQLALQELPHCEAMEDADGIVRWLWACYQQEAGWLVRLERYDDDMRLRRAVAGRGERLAVAACRAFLLTVWGGTAP